MTNENMNPHFLGESGIKHDPINPIQVVEIANIQEWIKDQASEFELAEYELKEGKKDQFTLVSKIASIMGELDRIPKSGYNKQFDYNYVTESDVVGAIRPLMAKYKLMMIPSIRRYSVAEHKGKYNSMYIGTIEIKWTIIDGESAERLSFSMIGKGVDNLEKDIYKSITGNKKYALITLFMIDSGDDPERNDTPTDSAPPQNNQNRQNQSKNNSGNNQSRNQNKPPQDKNEGQEQVKQPTKGDLVTRWMTLDTSDKAVKDKRADFDDWYKKKADAGWDHMAMIQALTKKLHEKNQAEKQKAQDGPDGQDGQASK